MNQPAHLPGGWEQVAEAVEREPGIVFILGSMSAGKTTLVQFLAGSLNRKGRRLALVGADIGQSALGPPGVISGAVLGSSSQPIASIKPERMFFIGSTSPAGYLLETVACAKKMVEWAATESPFVLVDTTGLIDGPEGWLLKFHKIALIRPCHLIALQRAEELEPLIGAFSSDQGIRIYRLGVSPLARPRSPRERRAYREARFRDYFKGASTRLLSLAGLAVLGRRPSIQGKDGESAGPPDQGRSFPRYLLLGLNDAEHRTLALGIAQVFDESSQELFVYTPLTDLAAVRSVTWGDLRLDLGGRELGRAIPSG